MVPALAFDGSGNLYVADYLGNTVSKFAPGSTTPSATLTGLNDPVLWPSTAAATSTWPTTGDQHGEQVRAGEHHAQATLTGLNLPCPGLRRQRQPLRGQLWQQHGEQVRSGEHHAQCHAHRAGYPRALAFDGSGNLYVANYAQRTVSKFAPGSTTPTATLTGLNIPGPGLRRQRQPLRGQLQRRHGEQVRSGEHHHSHGGRRGHPLVARRRGR